MYKKKYNSHKTQHYDTTEIINGERQLTLGNEFLVVDVLCLLNKAVKQQVSTVILLVTLPTTTTHAYTIPRINTLH